MGILSMVIPAPLNTVKISFNNFWINMNEIERNIRMNGIIMVRITIHE